MTILSVFRLRRRILNGVLHLLHVNIRCVSVYLFELVHIFRNTTDFWFMLSMSCLSLSVIISVHCESSQRSTKTRPGFDIELFLNVQLNAWYCIGCIDGL